ncbi:hypothetical protein [Nitrospira moscoviensis]|nr:hypothetical protein [Nitrospira moscoviensis]
MEDPLVVLSAPNQALLQLSGNICPTFHGCANGETYFTVRGMYGDLTGNSFKITHTADDIIAPHFRVERNGAVHITHSTNIANEFWLGPPNWAQPIYNDGTQDLSYMLAVGNDNSGTVAGASIIAFGLPSYRYTGVYPSLIQAYGSVGLSVGRGAGQLTGTKVFDVADDGAMQIGKKPFASLPASPNGTMYYCPDCAFTNPCAAGGTGAFAKRLNGAWRCD